MKLRSFLPFLFYLGLLSAPGQALAADSWLVPQHDAGHSAYNPGVTWLYGNTVGTLRSLWSVPGVTAEVATDREVFALTSSRLLILDATSGRTLHSPTVAGLTGYATGEYTTSLAYGHGTVLVGTHRTVVGVDPHTGHRRWRVALGASALTVAGDTLYTAQSCPAGCTTPASAAITINTGRVEWRHQGNGGQEPTILGPYEYQAWGLTGGTTRVYETVTGVAAATLPYYGIWYGDSGGTYLSRLSAGGRSGGISRIGPTGKPLWTVKVGNVVPAVALAYHRVFATESSPYPSVVSLEGSTGKARWSTRVTAADAILVAHSVVLAHDPTTGAIFALNSSTGALEGVLTGRSAWKGSAVLTVAGRNVYLISSTGLTALSLPTG